MNLHKRLERLEQGNRPRHDADRGARAALWERILPLLSDDELAAIVGPGFDGFSVSDLERIAAGMYTPDVPVWEIPGDVLERLCELTTADERRLLGLPTQRFKHPGNRGVNLSK